MVPKLHVVNLKYSTPRNHMVVYTPDDVHFFYFSANEHKGIGKAKAAAMVHYKLHSKKEPSRNRAGGNSERC